MLTDDQLADRIGPRLRRELADIAPPPDLPARLRRRQARHTRRSFAGAAAAAAVVAGAATLTVGTSGPASPAPTPAILTAWTVTRQPDGSIKITIRDGRDPAGLQRKLRAAGIPASVHRGVRLARGCMIAPGGYGMADIDPLSSREVIFIIRPSRIPDGQGVSLSFFPIRGAGVTGKPHARVGAVRLDYVRRGPQCTGS
jgi:hypothetical protein